MVTDMCGLIHETNEPIASRICWQSVQSRAAKTFFTPAIIHPAADQITCLAGRKRTTQEIWFGKAGTRREIKRPGRARKIDAPN